MNIGSIHSMTMVFNKSQVSGFKLSPVLDGDGFPMLLEFALHLVASILDSATSYAKCLHQDTNRKVMPSWSKPDEEP
jgi:hypothetical protein